jgi:hypothetical protein
MGPEILLMPVATGALVFTGLKLRKQQQYRQRSVPSRSPVFD